VIFLKKKSCRMHRPYVIAIGRRLHSDYNTIFFTVIRESLMNVLLVGEIYKLESSSRNLGEQRSNGEFFCGKLLVLYRGIYIKMYSWIFPNLMSKSNVKIHYQGNHVRWLSIMFVGLLIQCNRAMVLLTVDRRLPVNSIYVGRWQ
jgi:hypothetical protein